MISDAIISDCGKYRYELRRIWQPKTDLVCFIMLNPSTADAYDDDSTIRKCMGFAARWGYGGIIVGNLFAYRTKSPKYLRAIIDRGIFNPIGPENNDHLKKLIQESKIVLCGWGNNGSYFNRDKEVLKMIPFPKCLEINKSGSPIHPLYAKGWLEPKDYKP